MPKKRATKYEKPSNPVHPSLSSSVQHSISRQGDGSIGEGQSVNDRLQQLRLQQNPRASTPFEAPPPHTVHPSVAAILKIPNAPPPRPRAGHTTTFGRRRVAGPPPPQSWTEEVAPTETCEFKRKKSPALPGYNLPRRGSLLDYSLKELARNYGFHIEYDQYHLATIPVHLKELLVHYLALYNPNAVDLASLATLFLDDAELEDATGTVDLFRLDLSTSIGRSLSLHDVKSLLRGSRQSSPAMAAAGIDSTRTSYSPYIPESWDSTSTLPRPLRPEPSLATITHLSLSSPPPKISWSYFLLHLLPSLPSQSLTHLSLAFWPTPTFTPNTLKATGPKNSLLDYPEPFSPGSTEPLTILRRVAKATLGLKWLDLTGCWPWMQLLADDGFDLSGGGPWAGLETLVVGQGLEIPALAPQNNPFLKPEYHSALRNIPFPLGHPGFDALRHREAYRIWKEKHPDPSFMYWAPIEWDISAYESVIEAKLKTPTPTIHHPLDETAAAPPPAVDEDQDGWSGESDHSRSKAKDPTPPRKTGIHFQRDWDEEWIQIMITEAVRWTQRGGSYPYSFPLHRA